MDVSNDLNFLENLVKKIREDRRKSELIEDLAIGFSFAAVVIDLIILFIFIYT